MDSKEQERTREPRRARLRRWLGLWAADILLISGGGLVSTGISMIYLPAGLIAAGVLLITGGVLYARGGVARDI